MERHRLDPEARPYDPEGLEPLAEVPAETFLSLDLRVGRIEHAEPLPGARQPSLRLEVDLGPQLGVRTSVAKIANYASESLVGRTVVAATNLPPLRVAGVVSRLLVLGGLEPDGTVRLLEVDGGLPPGSKVS